MSVSGPSTVLVIDDDEKVRMAHERVLSRAGFQVETAADGLEGLSKLMLDIDLVVLDGEMPHMDGFEVATRIREDPAHLALPIIMVTGLVGGAEQRRALEVGINDFVNKPVDPALLVFRCQWLTSLKNANDQLSRENEQLRRSMDGAQTTLRTALAEMTDARRATYVAHLDTIRRLTLAAEYKDADTAGHIERIGLFSQIIGRAVGMSTGEAERLLHAAPMHDVGKIAIPDDVLLKPGRLTEEEWEIMRTHTTVGAEILRGSPSQILQLGEKIALTHHERWDGSGYPNGLQGEEIPLEGRICAVVDFYDALTMDRPYRDALPIPEVVRMMEDEAGKHFDPELLRVFMDVRPQIEDARPGGPV